MSKISTKPNIYHWIEYLVIQVFELLLRFFPVSLVDKVSLFVGQIAWYLFSSRRRIVIRNCRIAWGHLINHDEVQELSKSIFKTTAANILCGMKLALMDHKIVEQHVSISGLEMLKQQLTSHSKGVILVLAHMGNWEILAKLNMLLAPSRPSAAFFRPLNNPLMNAKVMKRRMSSGTKLFSNKEGFIGACSHLRDGGLLGILADQNAGNSGVRMPFFGRITSCTPLVEILHKRTEAAIFYVSLSRIGHARWHINLRKHADNDSCDTSVIMKGIEVSLSESRSDVFWFDNRWKLGVRKPFLRTQSRLPKTPYRQSKPWQVVIIFSDDPAICTASIPAVEKLIRQEPDFHFFLINAPCDLNAHNAERAFMPENITASKYLRVLDHSQSYPLDLVLFFTAPEEQFDSRVISDIPWCAGFSSKKSPDLTIRVPYPETAMSDASSWYHLIEVLGSAPR